ncbi:ABC transporter permease [Salipiger thiooxidans]|uniref:ABC transporter permease n=1 Tax=Salipiger thiooxidans TaxID=282683 RepID=UPI001CD5C8A3|nr:ABC transporter permease subunit [Salipiger thiooxidans]MCA0848638.1 ABC transporter permease subunit [Salipiger thiooxidans]
MSQPEIRLFERATGLAVNQLEPQRDLRQRLLQVVVLAIAFVVGTTSPALAQVNLNLGKAARNLGATGAQAFHTIALPQIRPAAMSGALFAFITSLDEVVISSFISGGENATLTKKMFSRLREQVDPTIAAVASLLIGVTVVVLLAVILLSRRGGERQAPGRSKDPRTVPGRAGQYAG